MFNITKNAKNLPNAVPEPHIIDDKERSDKAKTIEGDFLRLPKNIEELDDCPSSAKDNETVIIIEL